MAVQGLMTAATMLMRVEGPTDSVTTLAITDPDLMRHPFLMITEPGCWSPTDAEVKILRTYLLKGGFVVFDDLTLSSETMRTYEIAIAHFEQWMKRVLPEIKPMRIEDPSNSVYNLFLTVEPSNVPGLKGTGSTPGEVWGFYRENDPTRPLMAVANYRTRVGEYWRYTKGLGSGLGKGRGETAYKLGLNYFVYGLSH
jgi:hypothetical protein